MSITVKSKKIINIINTKYEKYIDDDEEYCDLKYIKDMCKIYHEKKTEKKEKNTDEIELDDILFSSLKIKNQREKFKSNKDAIKSEEFKKKYYFFINIIYTCLRMEVEIFNFTKDIATLKNNYELVKSLEKKKKELITDHTNTLKSQLKNIADKISDDYYEYVNIYVVKLKLIEKMLECIRKCLFAETLTKNDNLLALLLPYFFQKIKIIEEYS